MNIVHICLSGVYIEGMGYQENILPKKHKDMGNEVTIVASFDDYNGKISYRVEDGFYSYINGDGIKVYLLERIKKLDHFGLWGFYKCLANVLYISNADILFVHGGQFQSLGAIQKYCKEHKNVKLFVDQHGDYYNMPIDNWKQKVVQKVFIKWRMRAISKYVTKFWGVTPWRCEYLRDVYEIQEDKIELLVMGGDDEIINTYNKKEVRVKTRRELNVSDDDFVIVTGGKLDKAKNTLQLMKVVKDINMDNIKLVIFGNVSDEIKENFSNLVIDKHIRYVGWISANEAYRYFLAGNLVAFPGTHSVLWEQACACGIPGIFKDWHGMHHVDCGGNAVFICGDDVEEIKKCILNIYGDSSKYNAMKKVAVEKAMDEFAYSRLAKRSIGL